LSDQAHDTQLTRNRIAFYGGSFDPPHNGHLSVASALIDLFRLDEFVFIPAFHAPHKKRTKPTAALHRYTMLALATNDDPRIILSTMEIDAPEKPYTVETLGRLTVAMPDSEIFFVIGADSWSEINTWREWEKVLTMTNQIVVTRPGFDIDLGHVTEAIRERIVDLRSGSTANCSHPGGCIYITDAVNLDISATRIRENIRNGDARWRNEVPKEVAKYIEKYQIYR
jgi:nicotinate-nucleotide adenylyltransferase